MILNKKYILFSKSVLRQNFSKMNNDLKLWCDITNIIAPGFANDMTPSKNFTALNDAVDRVFQCDCPTTPIDSSYSDLMDSRAEYYKLLIEDTGKDIVLYYSGGIDSTGILCSFIKNFEPKHMNKLVLRINPASLHNNPHMWKTFISDGRIRTEVFYAAGTCPINNQTSVLVYGAPDPWGNNDILDYLTYTSKSPFDSITIEDIINFYVLFYGLNKHIVQKYVEFVFDYDSLNGYRIETVHDFFFWITVYFKYQTRYLGFTAIANKIDPDFEYEDINDTNSIFYNLEHFMPWHLANLNQTTSVIPGQPLSFKNELKKYIFNVNKDNTYFLLSRHRGYKLVSNILQDQNILAIAEDGERIHYNYSDISEEFVDKMNSFRIKNVLG